MVIRRVMWFEIRAVRPLKVVVMFPNCCTDDHVLDEDLLRSAGRVLYHVGEWRLHVAD